ncbi:MAG TPA: DUF2490 domain-containing protein [Bacteroidales bacterium]|nr:DUF2490 domain-containing protein [Bacteroidales bacterium]
MRAIRFSRQLILPVLLLLFCSLTLSGQNNDFGIWYGVSTSMQVKKKLQLDLQTQLRTFNNASTVDEGYLEGGIEYKWKKYMSFEINYRFSKVYEKDLNYHTRHKWFADVKADHDVGRINFSGRLRFQRQDKTYYDSENDRLPEYHGRIRLKAEYKTPSFPVNPYISAESFIRMSEQDEDRIDKYRYTAGFTFKINKKQSIDADYTLQHDLAPHILNTSLIAIEYKFKFK